jgi:hypothetical protein
MSAALVGPVVAGGSPHVPGKDRRPVPIVLMAAWGALFLNVLAFSAMEILLPVPQPLGQAVTQGALPVALVLALLANRHGVIVPNTLLVLLTVLAVAALAVSLQNEYLANSVFRACRFLGFVAVLWALTPWFGRRDMVLLRCYRYCLGAVLASVLLGAAVAPGVAFAFEGRLAGVLWPVPPTQVAHYAAVMLGTTIVLWLCRVIGTGHAVLVVLVSGGPLLLTHTRTALVAVVVGLLVAGASLFLGQARVRRVSALAASLGIVGVSVFATQLTTWALRGQSTEEAGQLTGRTKVWTQVFAVDRSTLGDLFGSGMSDQSFKGLPIDSNWVATFWDLGWFGVGVAGALILALLLVAVTRERGPHRALALFLVTYCLVASITETGLSAPSPYLLDLAVAAALLAPAIGGRAS